MAWQGNLWNDIHKVATKNIKIVQPYQTVQQVLDSITDASETNKYFVLVPSGHEDEYFDWKPYIDVKFLDNLEERWQLDELEGWDDLSNWIIYGGNGEIIDNGYGKKTLKVTCDSNPSLIFASHLDLRRYQGLMFNFSYPVHNSANPTFIRIRIVFSNGAGYIQTAGFGNEGAGQYERRIYLPFGVDCYNYTYVDKERIDWSDVQIYLLTGGFQSGDEIYLTDFKLVRTYPYPAVLMRTDDSGIDGNYRIACLKELENQRIPVVWAVVANDIYDLTTDDDRNVDPTWLHLFQSKGMVSIVNHSFSHPYFNNIDEKATAFEVLASRYVFERLALSDATRWWISPHRSTNSHLEKYLRELGYLSINGYIGNNPPISEDLDHDEIPVGFKFTKKGGIFVFTFHGADVDTEDKMISFLQTVSEVKQFCRFISIKDIERLMNNSHEKFTPRQTKPTLFQVLDSDFDMYFFHKQLFLNPNGADRNINVQPYKLRHGDTFLIVNTGTSGNLIFDPSGANITISPSSSIKVVYTGEGWMQV